LASGRWETYRLGTTVRLRRVGASKTKAKPAAAVVVDEPAVVDESLTKAELVAEAERRGVDISGTKAEIVERLNG
jgi:SAP domain